MCEPIMLKAERDCKTLLTMLGIIMSNVIGTNNLYKIEISQKIEKFICASSVEIYGENKGDVEKIDENYLGFIDCNTLRSGYPESKRVTESIAVAYYHKYGINYNVIRFSRIYGPTMLMSDSKATKAILDISKIKNIGWISRYPFPSSLVLTLDILKEIESNL